MAQSGVNAIIYNVSLSLSACFAGLVPCVLYVTGTDIESSVRRLRDTGRKPVFCISEPDNSKRWKKTQPCVSDCLVLLDYCPGTVLLVLTMISVTREKKTVGSHLLYITLSATHQNSIVCFWHHLPLHLTSKSSTVFKLSLNLLMGYCFFFFNLHTNDAQVHHPPLKHCSHLFFDSGVDLFKSP